MGSLTEETEKEAEISHPGENTAMYCRLSPGIRAIGGVSWRLQSVGLTQKGKSLAKDSIMVLQYGSAS